jgi:transposase InsO family protein
MGADITYIHTQDSWLYLSVVIDLYSRTVIGWTMNKHLISLHVGLKLPAKYYTIE